MKGNISKSFLRNRNIRIVTILVVTFILLMIIISVCRGCSNDIERGGTYRPTLPEIQLNGDDGHTSTQSVSGIKLKATTGFVFNAKTRFQNVDIPNLSDNEYAFTFAIYLSDGTEVVRSDYVLPGETVNVVETKSELKPGIYSGALLVYRCFTKSEPHTAISQCEFPIEIKVIE